MHHIGVALRIKYKLRDVPTEQEASEWAILVDALCREGVDAEEAGSIAAKQLFEIDKNLVLKAEADTIESLLEQARKK